MFLKVVIVALLAGVAHLSSALEPPPGLGRPFEAPNNKTIDQAILETLGNIDVAANMMREQGSEILAELDMYLSMEQFNKMYQPPQPEDMIEMGLMPAPIGVSADDPRYSRNVPTDFASQATREKRKASATAVRWTNDVVPYLFANGHFSKSEEYLVRRAMTEWERYTCMNFRPATSMDKNSLRFQNGQGCNSQLGMRGGIQALNLEAPGCRFKGLYLHEIGHALGLVHEHQLPDRDNYIRILFQNVSPHMRIWFNKYREDELTRMNVKYQLSSVMHYGITAFSKDGYSQTIQALDPSKEDTIGKVYLKELAYTDVEIVNKFYECAKHCPDQNKCGSSGHLDQNCDCICEDGSSDCDSSHTATDPNCKNVYFDWPCYIWANQGECNRNPFYMQRDCAKACGVCGTTARGECKDHYKSAKCQMWKERGDCVTNTKWMKEHCGVTCNFCGTGTRPEENCANKYAEEEKCERWARDGECIVNRVWMFQNCQKSCHMCLETGSGTNSTGGGFDEDDIKCVDTDRYCQTWADNGECINNPPWMIDNCRKACKKCDDGTCKNLYSDVRCDVWAQKHECMSNSKWMSKWCARSCATGLCAGTDPSLTTTTTTTTQEPPSTTTPRSTTDGSCTNTHNSDTQCDLWANAGHCSINPSWMLNHCARSCSIAANSGACGGSDGDRETPRSTDSSGGATNECHDAEGLCSVWAKEGQCDGDSSIYMLKNCKKSCNNCNGCRDASYMCEVWAKANHCAQNPRYMMRHCQKSCDACVIARDSVEVRPDGKVGPDGNSATLPTGNNNLIWLLAAKVFLLLLACTNH